ncbi:dockerin type I domain-containing protein [Stieleria sp. TO1_6]|uniref:dockerin type I domain-containing protein n=1 Tax=Stieleria tagensis TaxID=2956795 RepID=UPI00209B767D|nr:dockerin type I domain-containing protein [Stieleria tagensis]MCO8124268.1 dockerin type I domain-containing protein [Stieleria tagensis]
MSSTRFRPALQHLESRRVLATLVVTSADDRVFDDGQLTLREAVMAANQNISVDGSLAGSAGADVIEFAPSLSGRTIDLALGELWITESLSIVGSGADQTVIDAGNQSRVFVLSDDSATQQFELSAMTLQNGNALAASSAAPGFGGSVLFVSSNRSSLLVSDLLVQSSRADVGGGLHLDNTITHIDGTTITNNQAAFGGGISIQNSLVTLTNTTLTDNQASQVGGGLDHFSNDPGGRSVVDLVHVTMVNNQAPTGRNIRSGGDAGEAVFRFANSIIFGSSTQPELLADDFGASTSVVSLGGNLVDHSVRLDDTTVLDRRVLSFERTPDTLDDHGGPVPTLAMHPLDFAVDLGRNDLAVGPGPDRLMGTADDQAIQSDQRGATFSRVIDAGSGVPTVDAGAFEIQSQRFIPQQLVVSNTADVQFRDQQPDLNDLTLREAIQLSNLKRGSNSISFAESLQGETITLSSGRTLYVYDELDLVGLGADRLTIDADQQNRHFVFQANEELGITFTIQGLRLIGGNAPSAGGAIFAFRNHLVVRETHFENNRSPYAAGALFVRAMTADVVNSSFVSNRSATNGGAVGVLNSSITMTGVTASGNTAGESAGAVHTRISNPDFVRVTSIQNSTFVDNEAPIGGDVVVRPDFGLQGTIELTSNIFASSVVGTQSIVNVLADADLPGRIVSHGSNLVIDDSLAGLSALDLGNTDPRLAGRLIGTNGLAAHAPLPDSPAIDAADDTRLPPDQFDLDNDGDLSEPIPIDVLGQPRSVALAGTSGGNLTDIGSYEVNRNVTVSSANGPIGLLLDSDNVVITAANEIILAVASEHVNAITLRGTHGDDAMELADLTGRPIDAGNLPPITVDANGGSDSIVFSRTYVDPSESRVTFGENVQPTLDDEFAHGVRITPRLLRSALVNPTVGLDWRVDSSGPLSTLDGWEYVGHQWIDGSLARRFQADGIEIRVLYSQLWSNPLVTQDVDGNNDVTPRDALIVINALAGQFVFDPDTQELNDPAEFDSIPDFFFDVNRDGRLTPIDALGVINYLGQQRADGEPESIQSDFLDSINRESADRALEQLVAMEWF